MGEIRPHLTKAMVRVNGRLLTMTEPTKLFKELYGGDSLIGFTSVVDAFEKQGWEATWDSCECLPAGARYHDGSAVVPNRILNLISRSMITSTEAKVLKKYNIR